MQRMRTLIPEVSAASADGLHHMKYARVLTTSNKVQHNVIQHSGNGLLTVCWRLWFRQLAFLRS